MPILVVRYGWTACVESHIRPGVRSGLAVNRDGVLSGGLQRHFPMSGVGGGNSKETNGKACHQQQVIEKHKRRGAQTTGRKDQWEGFITSSKQQSRSSKSYSQSLGSGCGRPTFSVLIYCSTAYQMSQALFLQFLDKGQERKWGRRRRAGASPALTEKVISPVRGGAGGPARRRR